MKPDSAVIYFTVCSGTGYGMIASLLSLFFYTEVNIEFHVKLFIISLSFFLIISGLIASTIHLGHPKRAWRALSQWRSSWLSREGIAAILTFAPLCLFYIFWIFDNNSNYTLSFLTLSAFSCQITVFCTAKIYSSLKAIPSWHNPFVPILYILNSLVLGSIITFTIFFCFGIRMDILSNSIVILSSSALFTKLLYWYSIRVNSKSDISTATGLGTKNKTSFFEGPHTGNNFLTSEMVNTINNLKSFLLRLALCIFIYIIPTYFILQKNYLVVSDNIISINLILVSILALIGMFIERYLFFIESKHTVSLFYGNKTI